MNISHIAKLARLHLTGEEAGLYESQIDSILKYVNKLQELDTEGVPELQHAIYVTNVFREDEISRADSDSRECCLENFSHRKEDLLQVPGVFNNETSL